MLLYLDDDSVRAVLIRRLITEGHDLLTPTEAGIAGEEDPTHSGHTAGRTKQRFVMFTKSFFQFPFPTLILYLPDHRCEHLPLIDMTPLTPLFVAAVALFWIHPKKHG